MKTRLVITLIIAVLINVVFFVAYFVFSLRMRQYIVGEMSFETLVWSFKIATLVMSVVATSVMVALFWFVSGLVLGDVDQLSKEMRQIAVGNVDIEINKSTYDIFQQMSTDLAAVQKAIIDSHTNSEKVVKEKTKMLTLKITDLEKLRDLTTDSILLAKNMQQERDQLLIQVHRLQDKRKQA